MKNLDLIIEISELVERRAEGVYWDFKQQWHANNADLLHDIICMANSPANRDCYIIIGIEDKTCKIVGVSEENRKNQQNVIELLRQKPKWAGGYIPEVYVKTIQVSNSEIDVIIIKQSNNTPFYLLEDYTNNGFQIHKGVIYTRKGDTNTPKTSTADLYDAEILWKRRFGLLYSPSQRAKFYLTDIENWERIDGEVDKFGTNRYLCFYRPDPDYTVHLVFDSEDKERSPMDINDDTIGSRFYYLFAFCNVSYHTDYSYDKVVLYYKDIPLFSDTIDCVDEGRTKIVPPKLGKKPCYIKDSLRYLVMEFVFMYWGQSYSDEAKDMLLRVIPVFENSSECEEFGDYIEHNGFPRMMLGSKAQMQDEALDRFNRTMVEAYEDYGNPPVCGIIAGQLKKNPNMVVNFAKPNNRDFDEITKCLRTGKMLVDWLNDWRNHLV